MENASINITLSKEAYYMLKFCISSDDSGKALYQYEHYRVYFIERTLLPVIYLRK